MSAEPLLSVDRLSVHFRAGGNLLTGLSLVRAVEGVSFTLQQGETLSIVGESGSGKSTLARAILRLVPATKGSVHYRGENLVTLSQDQMRARRRMMQMVFQDPIASLSPRRTVEQIIEEPLRVHFPDLDRAQRMQRVAETMDAIGLLPDMRNRYPHEFSGGQRQRIGIARALCVGPQVIIADEPVSALDVSVQAKVLELMAELRRELGMFGLVGLEGLQPLGASGRPDLASTGEVLRDGPRDVKRLLRQPKRRFGLAEFLLP